MKNNNEGIEKEIEEWDEIKDKYFEILIPNLKQAISWLRKLGLSIKKRKTGYWIQINQEKEK